MSSSGFPIPVVRCGLPPKNGLLLPLLYGTAGDLFVLSVSFFVDDANVALAIVAVLVIITLGQRWGSAKALAIMDKFLGVGFRPLFQRRTF